MHFDENTIPFVTGDTHYYHSNVIKYCNRPFKSETEMRNRMIENYNNVVPKDGTCFFLGDVAMMGPSQWEKMKGLLNNLNGTKHLILGNHDEIKPFRYLECGFSSVHTSLIITVDMKIQQLTDTSAYLKLFQKKISSFRENFFLVHDPSFWNTMPKNHICLCAHIHNLFKIIPEKKIINVGVDLWNFTPLNIADATYYLMQLIASRDITTGLTIPTGVFDEKNV